MQITPGGRRVFIHTGGKPIDAGNPALVLVHGAGTDHTFWAMQARFFAHHGFSVLVPDLPGHGRSAGPAETTIPALADWLWRTLDVIGSAKVALAGHSMGSLVALAAAAAVPDRVTALVLVGSAPKIAVHADLIAAAKVDTPLAIELITEWGFGRAARLGGHTAPGMWMTGGGKRLIAAAPPGALAADLVACDIWEGGPAAAAKIACPTLLIAGGDDRMTPPRIGETLVKSIAGALMEVFPDTGHMIMVEGDQRDHRFDPPFSCERAMTDDAKAERNLRRADYRHFLAVPTRWMDTDVYGHVNNVTYYSYFDTAVNQHLIEHGALDVKNSPDIGVVVETMCRFFKPVAFPDKLEAGLRLGKLGKSSVRYEIGIFKAGADEAAAAGHFVHVYVRRSDFAVIPVPGAVRRAAGKLAVK